jgi:hypothetical protein
VTAQLQPIDLVAPGFRGLNLSQSSNVLRPEYATSAQNCLLDASGRLSARAGYTNVTTTAITADVPVKSIHEYNEGDGTASIILAWDGGISTSLDNPEGSDISGSVANAAGNWWFQDFNDKVIGFADGEEPIVYTGTGSFATIVESNGTTPSVYSGIGLAAYGRVWAVDADSQTIKYTGLLDETDWGSSSAGSIDMRKVWTDGTDKITALVAFNKSLVIFGRKHIIFMEDGLNTALGMDPTRLFAKDVISGTGCVSQWSIQPIGDSDIYFLSPNGVQSLSRIVSERSNPITTVSNTVRSELVSGVNAETPDNIRSFYSPTLGVYGLTLPTSQVTWIMDPRYPFQDEIGELLVPITKWTLAPSAWCSRDSSDLLLGIQNGVGLYGGSDDAGSSFRFIYASPWLDLGENLANRVKILKRIGAIIFVENDVDILFKWAQDFSPGFRSLVVRTAGDAADEWGVAEFGIGEWSGGLALRILRLPARGKGQYFRMEVEGDVSGTFALQQLELFAKIGRLA